MHTRQTNIRPWAVLTKGLLLFLLLNLLYALPWSNDLKTVTIYNSLLPGAKRFKGNTDLDLHFSTHIISQPKASNEFRVLFIGDSSTYGVLLHEDDTMAELINNSSYKTCNDKEVRVYNLASTGQSSLMDLMMMDKAQWEEPDMIVWFYTLNTFDDEAITLSRKFLPTQLAHIGNVKINRQLVPNFVLNNIKETIDVVSKYNLRIRLPSKLVRDAENSFIKSTFVYQRYFLGDWLNLQLTGIRFEAIDGAEDQRDRFKPVQDIELSSDPSYRELSQPVSNERLVYSEALEMAMRSFNNHPILLVNEPIFISTGKNSDIHYNNAYPKWAYDQYREYMSSLASANQWNYLDLWNLVPASEFTNSSFHRSPEGERLVAEKVAPAILDLACKK